MLLSALQILIARFCLEQRKQGADRASYCSDQANIDMRSPADLFSTGVDLNDLRFLWEELRVGKVAAKNDERVRIHHGRIAGGEAK